MSKKMLVLSIAVLFSAQAGLAMAANPDTSPGCGRCPCGSVEAIRAMAANLNTGPGCGLGKLMWADYKGQKEIAPQVMMAITNIIGMNTFAISSGTSGCTHDGKILSEHKTTVFASLNFDVLTAEMAQGQGEHLASLATLMGVPAERHAAFFAMTQERHASLVQAGEASPVALVKSLNDAIAGHPVLARASVR